MIYFNTIFANLLNRRNDFKIMHKIGIRKKEMYWMVMKEGLRQGCMAAGVTVIVQVALSVNDYITKPFKLGEVLSRIHALLRRFGEFHKNDTILESNGIKIDQTERTCWKGGTELPLTLVEYKLLCLFLKNPNRILTRELILDCLWDGNGSYVDDNTLSVYIRRLRRKIEDAPNSPAKLLTEIGFGYRWVSGPSAGE